MCKNKCKDENCICEPIVNDKKKDIEKGYCDCGCDDESLQCSCK